MISSYSFRKFERELIFVKIPATYQSGSVAARCGRYIWRAFKSGKEETAEILPSLITAFEYLFVLHDHEHNELFSLEVEENLYGTDVKIFLANKISSGETVSY